jgi:hypothetical protein
MPKESGILPLPDFLGVVVGPALAIALSTSVTRWSLWLRLRVIQSEYAAHAFINLTCILVTGYLLLLSAKQVA